VLEMAANHIHSATQQDFEDSTNLLLGGTLEASRGHTRALIVRAFDKSTLTPCIVKITAAAAVNREAEVYQRLKNSNLNYVPHEKVTIQRRHTRTGETVDKSMCLKMPAFVCSLASVPKHVPEDLVLTRVSTDILPALRHMHTLGIYHMDVKLENILLDAQGRWCLSDFGSCASSAEDQYAITAHKKPADLQSTPPSARYDWVLLAVACMDLTVDFLARHPRFKLADLSRAADCDLKNEEFKALIRSLLVD
jgi:serine/threonine protein kinase